MSNRTSAITMPTLLDPVLEPVIEEVPNQKKKKPKKFTPRDIQHFVETGEVKRVSKVAITLRLPPELLDLVDASAKEMGVSRTSYLTAAITLAVREGMKIGTR